MSAALPSQPAPSPRGRRNPLPVEALQEILGGLLRERETLRSSGAKRALERNRREIVRLQWQICHALIARYARFAGITCVTKGMGSSRPAAQSLITV